MLYVFHGPDEYTIQQAVNEMKAKLGDETTAALNTAQFDGRTVTLDGLRTTCDTMPFLSDKRLVIVEGLLARFEPRPGAEAAGDGAAKGRPDGDLEAGLKEYLPHLPDTARLVFVEHDTLSERNPILKLARENGGYIRAFSAPSGSGLSEWIGKRAREQGGGISPRAAETLAAFVGNNLRQLTQEIDKLLAYAGERPISEADVHLLVADAHEVKGWALTDALAARQRDQALPLLHSMLEEGDQPPVLMAMITRQFRILLQVRELAEGRVAPEAMAAQLKLHPYVIKKATPVAQGFSFARLEAIYRLLLATDYAVKTGRLDPVLALDLLVMEITTGN